MDCPQAVYQSVKMGERNEEVKNGELFQLVSVDLVFRERNSMCYICTYNHFFFFPLTMWLVGS